MDFCTSTYCATEQEVILNLSGLKNCDNIEFFINKVSDVKLLVTLLIKVCH